MNPASPKNPQGLSNDLAIMFGIIASIGTLLTIVVSIVQFRRLAGVDSIQPNDVELQPITDSHRNNNVLNICPDDVQSDSFRSAEDLQRTDGHRRAHHDTTERIDNTNVAAPEG